MINLFICFHWVNRRRRTEPGVPVMNGLCLRWRQDFSRLCCRKALKLPSLRRSYSNLNFNAIDEASQRRVFEESVVFGSGTPEEVRGWNIRLRNLGKQGKMAEARKLFDEMPRRDVVSYTSMIAIYLKNSDLPRAENLYHSMPGRSLVADSAMIHAYAKYGRLDFARQIFDHMPCKNVFTWTGLIAGYFQNGRVDEAYRLFTEMPHKNEVSWTTVLLGFARNGLIDEARETFNQIPSKNVVSWTAMIRAYVENNQINQALQLFYKMPERNLYSWNIMIQGCVDDDRVDEALHLFSCMPERNPISWTTMVTGLAQKGSTELARRYFDQTPRKDVPAWNAMITAYADKGLVMEARNLFNVMQERNVVTWNAMIDGYARSGPQDEALKLFIRMCHSQQKPNVITLTSVVIASQAISELLQAHALVINIGFVSETSLTNALVTMYSRLGDVISARRAFENLEAKDTLSWTAMILAYSHHGHGHLALQAFARMTRSGNEPDGITFVGVLSACSHAGLVTKGQMLFDSMRSAYNINPNKDHYCCLIDILSRAGLVREAIEVIRQMPPNECDAAVIGAILGSCKSLGEATDLVNLLGERLLELEAATSGSYVLLSNLHAANGRWDDFARLRKRMKETGVNKVPGCSHVEVRGENHSFYAGDRSHPHVQQIYGLLWERLLPVMRDHTCPCFETLASAADCNGKH